MVIWLPCQLASNKQSHWKKQDLLTHHMIHLTIQRCRDAEAPCSKIAWMGLSLNKLNRFVWSWQLNTAELKQREKSSKATRNILTGCPGCLNLPLTESLVEQVFTNWILVAVLLWALYWFLFWVGCSAFWLQSQAVQQYFYFSQSLTQTKRNKPLLIKHSAHFSLSQWRIKMSTWQPW